MIKYFYIFGEKNVRYGIQITLFTKEKFSKKKKALALWEDTQGKLVWYSNQE